jgi:prolyl-tRNA synthetase
MRLEKLFTKMLRDAPEGAETPGHQISMRGGYLHQTGAGLYTFTPLGLRVLRNIEKIIRQEIERLGCQEILMPMVSPASLWIESQRYDRVDVLLKFKTRGGTDCVLNPTHEEVICDYVRSCLQSYRQLPLALYQLQTKYRDELRVRAGLIRCREFLMKDAYSFHSSREDLESFYEAMRGSYHRIFQRIGLEGILDVAAPVGDMGGSMSHEFQMISPIGEDKLYICGSCDYRCNSEVLENLEKRGDSLLCPHCGGEFKEVHGVEVGNIFQLGTKYSESMGVSYSDSGGQRRFPTMGCYGIGVSRCMASLIEQRSAEGAAPGLWNMLIAPYRVHILTLGNSESVLTAAGEIEEGLKSLGIEALVDAGGEGAGSKFTNFELLGAPLGVVVSERSLAQGNVELRLGHVQGEYPQMLALSEACGSLERFILNEILSLL